MLAPAGRGQPGARFERADRRVTGGGSASGVGKDGMSTGTIGRRIRRKEDPRFLAGAGRYVADIRLPGMVHAAILRSPHAHARLRAVTLERVRAQPGVLAAVTAREAGALAGPLPSGQYPGLRSKGSPVLAGDKVRYVGEAVAVVLAETRYVAEDALELIEVEYAPLPPVQDLAAALAAGAPLVHEDVERNLAARIVLQTGDVEAAFRVASHVRDARLTVSRGGGMPIETRGLVAEYSRPTGQLTVWASTQVPHQVQQVLVEVLGLPPHRVRVIPPDVGGAFGAKLIVYPEDVLIPWLAWRFGRPVQWIEDRLEHLQTATQERGQVHDVKVAFDHEGRILGIVDIMAHDTGAYTPRGLVVPLLSATMLPGPYKVPAFRAEMSTVYTNRVPVTPYRGAGQPQAVFVIERIVDMIAGHLGLDRAEVRRRNLIQSGELPYHVGVPNYRGTGPLVYDSGDYPAVLRRALGAAGYEDLMALRHRARGQGRLVGIGLACYVELTGGGPYEGACVRVDPTGAVTVFTGGTTQGQGAETTLAQVCAAELGVAPETVTVIAGDTGGISQGWGAFASRVAVMAGSAVALAAREVRRKAMRLASQALEVGEADLDVADGNVTVRGVPGRAISLARLAGTAISAGAAQGVEPGLEATRYFQPTDMTFGAGAQVLLVEVDRETGAVQILRNVFVHDSGPPINPTVVEGQVMGAVAIGLGSALLERVVYDAEGQLLTSSFMDYLLPGPCEVPDLVLDHLETPSPLNPHGLKGVAESGTLPGPAAVASAVEDALAPMGIAIRESPLPPERLRALIAAAHGP